MKLMRLIFMIAFAVGSTGCLKTRSELSEEDEKKVIQSQVSQLQKTKADQDANLQNTESQIRMLYGRVETLEHQVTQLSTQKEDLTRKLSENEERFKQLEQALLQVEQQSQTSVALKPTKEDKRGKEPTKSLFDDAEELFNQKLWKKAVVLYQKYRDKSPNGADVAAATLKIGICFQEMKMSKEARVFYDEVIERHPKTKFAKVAQARLKEMTPIKKK